MVFLAAGTGVRHAEWMSIPVADGVPGIAPGRGEDSLIGTVLNQRFTLDRELGRGGMGAVFSATDQILGRSVAIKVLKELTGEEVGRKIRLEAQILARLLHEHVVRLYDFGVAEGAYFLVMEEVDGTSFQRRWKQIDLPERLRIAAQVADALDYAHHQSIIHRDVKPANILLTASDQAKLSDFGLSLLAGETDEAGMTRGTPHYMSPEQARGKVLDHRSDLYSLGIILYECTTGSTPFHGEPQAVMGQQVGAEPDPVRSKAPDAPEALEVLIHRLLAKDPAARPSSGRVVAESLREIIRGTDWHGPINGVETAEMPTAEVVETDLSPTVSAGAPIASPRSPSPSQPSPLASSLPDAPPSLARSLVEAVEAEPILLTADQRYLSGHYLAFLLGGSRQSGLIDRRPVDRRNADRARLLLGMTSIMIAGTRESVDQAARLMEERPDVRPMLSPIVVAKYLTSRETEPKRKRFRQARKRLLQSSAYARAKLRDARGILNPGLMPQTYDDLRKLAPARSEVDDELVERWNRLFEAWRSNFELRDSVLRYATRRAYRDPASVGLWPEVVYPLIERARWQRRHRSAFEGIWDVLCGNLHLPDAGVRLDRVIHRAVPERVVERLDDVVIEFEEEPEIAQEAEADAAADRLGLGDGSDSASYGELLAMEDDGPSRGLVRLADPNPIRLTLADLGALWREAVASLKDPTNKTVHRHVPIGPYRLVVIPSIRGKAAGMVSIQGMPNKQVELLTPSLRGASSSKPVVAAWVYRDNSLVLGYLDFQGQARYILWDASAGQQTNFDEPANLNSAVLQIGLEAPDQLDRALSRRFRPRNPA